MTRVHISWQRRPTQPTAERLRRLVRELLSRYDDGPYEVHVLMTGDTQIRVLNSTYREIDRATDVLSFPDGDRLPSGRVLLGEVIISIDAAKRQADEAGHSEGRELCELLLHGVIHLLGYDHDVDSGEMNALELGLREELLR
ncbi:MAG: rRNA maturation RNase YbeY [bacterium]|nr:rRNA maturation RNase YbeY [bacterium]